MKLSRELSPGEGSRGEKMVAIFTLFCIVFIDSGNKHKILNKITWKLPVWASCLFLSHLLFVWVSSYSGSLLCCCLLLVFKIYQVIHYVLKTGTDSTGPFTKR